MRIIAGRKKGLRLESPAGDVSRPILDRVKESLFSILYKYDLPAEAYVADLFSGVGSLGLESLSRGAAWVTFCERDPGIQRVLKNNIKKLNVEDQSMVLSSSAYTAGAMPVPGVERYNLVFVDPPYPTTEDVSAASQLSGLMDRLVDQVTPDALIVVRTHKRVTLLDAYGPFGVIDRREWGKMAVTFLQWKQREHDE